MNFFNDPLAIYYVLAICVAVTFIAFFTAIYLTSRSKSEARKGITLGLAEIDEVAPAALARIQQLDESIVDSLRTLSPLASENFSLARQFIALMEARRDRVEELVASGRLEDLFRAYKLISSPLENAGDHLTSVVFAKTILHLLPGQFGVALDTMLTSVENDLAGNTQVERYRSKDEHGHRRRKFTIRGFIESVTGKDVGK